jgi:hypothetical protein
MRTHARSLRMVIAITLHPLASKQVAPPASAVPAQRVRSPVERLGAIETAMGLPAGYGARIVNSSSFTSTRTQMHSAAHLKHDDANRANSHTYRDQEKKRPK